MLNSKISTAAKNLQLDTFAVLFNGGYMHIYSGEQPESVETGITDQVLLAVLGFNMFAFQNAENGVIVANTMVGESDAKATGIASWFRAFKSDGITPLLDGTCGESGTNLIFSSVNIVIHNRVSPTSFSHIFP